MTALRSIVLGVFAFILLPLAAAERLKFIGTFQEEANRIEFRLTFEATRTDSKANYAVAGKITARDGDYTVSGTFFAKTGKLRANVRRKNDIPGKPDYEKPLDGQIQPGGNKMTLKCVLLSPATRYPMDVAFDAYKVKDSKEEDAQIQVFQFDQVAGGTSADLRVDHFAGSAVVLSRNKQGERVERMVKFTPLPKAFAFGGKMTFKLDASSIPADEFCPVKLVLNYLDNDPKNNDPYGATITFDLSKGQRCFSKTLSWDCPGPSGFQGISITHNNSGPYYLYKVASMKRRDFDALTSSYNVAQGVGTTNTGSATNPSTGSSTGRSTGTSTGSVSGGNTTTTGGTKPLATTVALMVTGIKGDVVVKPRNSTDWTPMTSTTALTAGMAISVDPDSSLTLQMPNGATIVLEGGTELRLEDLSPSGGQARAIVRMMAGSLIYRHQGRNDTIKSDFVIRANECVTSVRGTDFTMTYSPKEGTVRIDLREGKLDFTPSPNQQALPLEGPTTITWKITN